MDVDAVGLDPAPSFRRPLQVLDSSGRALWSCTTWRGTPRLRCFERPDGPHQAGRYVLTFPTKRDERQRVEIDLDGRERMLIVRGYTDGLIVVERVRAADEITFGTPRLGEQGMQVDVTITSGTWCGWGGFMRGQDEWTALGWRTRSRDRVCECSQCGQPEPIRSGDVWFWPVDGSVVTWTRLDREVVPADPVHGCDREALTARWHQERERASGQPLIRDVWVATRLIEPNVSW